MERIELLDESRAPMMARPYFEGGDPGPIVAALAHVPELLAPTLQFVGAALGDGAVPVRYKEFAILRTSALLGCQYCIHSHSAVALDAGLSSDEVRSLRGERPLDTVFHEDAERALIAWIDAVGGASGPVPDDVWTDAARHFPLHQLVELTVVIGATLMLNRFATAFALPTSGAVRDRLAEESLLWPS
jgi:AhpD family alkylhydroperoxidase